MFAGGSTSRVVRETAGQTLATFGDSAIYNTFIYVMGISDGIWIRV